jgi:hypothetical protein
VTKQVMKKAREVSGSDAATFRNGDMGIRYNAQNI